MVWHCHPELWRRFNCTRRLPVDMKLLLVSSFSNNFVNNFITLRSINPFSTSPLIELGKVAAPASLSHAFSTSCYHLSSIKFSALFVFQLFSSKWFNCSFSCTIWSVTIPSYNTRRKADQMRDQENGRKKAP